LTNIFFSIIIPAYNVEKYIGRAISSVLNQGFQDFEIIIVNDGSFDKTADAIDEYAKTKKNIYVVNHLQNDSLHIARMDGVAASKGQYVVFLDGDDYFTDNAFDILYNEIKQNPGYDFYEFGYIRQPSHDVVFPSFTGEDRFSAYFSRDQNLAPTMWNKAYNADLLKKAFDIMEKTYINYVEDTYESVVIAFYAKKIFQIKKNITNYRIDTGISNTYRDYDKTIVFMQSIKTLNILLENFIKRNNQNIELNNFNYKFLTDTINYIFSQKNKNDIKKLFQKIPDVFDTKITVEYLFNLENSYRKIVSITNSRYYKLGLRFLPPLQKIKKIFTH
jgi:glycosyltransferase involved in cell wall biosynthesis